MRASTPVSVAGSFWHEPPTAGKPPAPGVLSKVLEINMFRYLANVVVIGVQNLDDSNRCRVVVTRRIFDFEEETIIDEYVDPGKSRFWTIAGMYIYSIYIDREARIGFVPVLEVGLPPDNRGRVRVSLTSTGGDDLSSHVQNLDIPLSSLRDAITGVDSRSLTDIYDRLGESLPRYARLQIYDSSTGTWRNVVDAVPIAGAVSVSNLPSEYPLPSSQVATLKNKVRIMAWNPSASRYELVEGYEGSKSFAYDSNGNLTEVQLTIILDDGSTRTVRRTFSYDSYGNLTQVSQWEVVS